MGREFVRDQPVQGAMYQALQSQIMSSYMGLSRPNNIGNNPWSHMTGVSFQKPLSGSTTGAPPVAGFNYT